jgi:NAD(P)-dependent dehydrogenase (short-subunit alcohol dehydrogenase family)
MREPAPASPDHGHDPLEPDTARTRETRTLNTVRSVRLSLYNSCSVFRNGCDLDLAARGKEALEDLAGRLAADHGVDVAGLSGLPAGRIAIPREIADMVAFLASDRSAYTSGVIVTIDGGLCAAT